jgi:allophanate hydrolase
MKKTIDFPAVMSIQWLRDMYLSERLTPDDVVTEIIKRSEKDQEMNIWITPPSMETLSPYLERLKSLDPVSQPLWGIPFAIKDNIDMMDVPTTAGCSDYTYIPTEHATIVERLVTAGAIPLGKTNLDQFATGLVGTRSPHGETKNALQPELISGGSSSGSAVAVARGQAAFALGTDTAGSGRVPAALNNLVGFKSSVGAWPIKGVVPACQSIDCVSVFTINSDDAAMVDKIARGIDVLDPWSRSVIRRESKLPEKLILPSQPLPFYGPYAEEYENAWKSSVLELEKMNVTIEYVDPELFLQTGKILYEGPWVAERWAGLGEFIESHPGSALPVTEKILRNGSKPAYTAAALFQTMYQLKEMKRKVDILLKDSVLVMPTCGGTWTREQVTADPIGTNSQMGLFTNHCNLLDLAAIALPVKEADCNLPFGITAFSLHDQENLLFGFSTLLTKKEQTPSSEPLKEDCTLVAVCGLHMRGFPLEKQMNELGARFIREDVTAVKYQFIKLPTEPAKPGLIKNPTIGASIEVEIWEMSLASFGQFVASIPAPLGIGKVELKNGEEVPGFVCEGYAVKEGEDITASGGWRAAMAMIKTLN